MRVPITHDVAVVGLGPVGELAALLLARGGLTVLAIERENEAYAQPRVGVLDGEALRTLQKAGVLGQATRDMILGIGAQYCSQRGEVLATVMPSDMPQGHPWLTAIYQPMLDRTLRLSMNDLPGIETFTGHTLVALAQDAEAVELEFCDANGCRKRARTRYVLGCDGANSTTRTAIGVSLAGKDYEEPWEIIDARLPEPIARVPYVSITLDPARPLLTTRLAAGHHRWERMVSPGEDLDAILQPHSARKLISEFVDPDEAEIMRHVIYTFGAKCSERWRVGRVFLCGDAAHLMPPFAGQGLNSGIRDVTNLTWKLVSVVVGDADPSILNTYEAERRPHVEETTKLSIRLGGLVRVRSKHVAVLRDSMLRALMRIPKIAKIVREGRFRRPARYRTGLLDEHPRRSPVGHIFPQPIVRSFDGDHHRLDDVTGSGWRIIGWESDPRTGLAERERRLAEDVLGAMFATLCPLGDRQVGPDASIGALEDLYSVAGPLFRRSPYVVVRPDHYVYANPAGPELGACLSKLVARLSTGPTGLPAHPIAPDAT